jgi:DNA-binding transcriptional MocR family regulator
LVKLEAEKMKRYIQIADKIEKYIQDSQLKPGEKIPSIRQFAAEFSCSKLTVQRAFNLLKTRGYLENIIGSGSYIRFPQKIDRSENVFDFKTNYISETFFPYQEAEQIFANLFEDQQAGVFSAPPTEGDPELIRTLGEFYHVPIQRMLIISGAQQGLDLTAKVFSSGISESILFEDPTYAGAISLFRAKHFVPLEEDGPNIHALESILSAQIRLFYAMPTVHNPTGISYSLEKKMKIAQKARSHALYIVEDDYLSEYHELQDPRFVDIIPDKTIYIKSLSQTTVSGIRLGFMIVPEDLYEKFLYNKFISDISSAGILQKFMREFIHQGHFRNHIHKTAEKIDERKDRIRSLLSAYPALSLPGPQYGYSLWIKSREYREPPNPPWHHGSDFSFSPEYRNYFRISFLNLDDVTFERALAYLDRSLFQMYKTV